MPKPPTPREFVDASARVEKFVSQLLKQAPSVQKDVQVIRQAALSQKGTTLSSFVGRLVKGALSLGND